MERSRAAAVLLCAATTWVAAGWGGSGGVAGDVALVAATVTAALVVSVRPLWPDALLLLPPLVAFEWSEGYLQPLVIALVLGGGGVAWLLRSRLRLQAQLADRAAQLEGEREEFVREAIRYERGRIARELHDVVAHHVSMVVVQAAAAERVLQAQPAFAQEAMREIARAAAEASAEVDALVELLGAEVLPADRALTELLDELVARAGRAGLQVRLTVEGPLPALPRPTVASVHRVVQEAVTNALKHAPGAAVSLRVGTSPGAVVANVRNGPAPAGPLARTGGGHGVEGMRDRVAAVGGCCRAGPTPDGGWEVTLVVPDC